MISGHQVFLTSGDQDAKTSIRIDFLASLFHDELSPRFIHPISVQFCSRCRLRERAVRLFRLAGEQAGTRRDIRPVFGGQKHYMFCPRQAVFSVTRNRFRNRKQLARKGVENSSEVVVFYRAPHVPRPDFNVRHPSFKNGDLGRHNCVLRTKEKEQTFKGCSDKWGDIMFRFSDENHTGFLTVIAKYDEHSVAGSISNRGRDATLSSYT